MASSRSTPAPVESPHRNLCSRRPVSEMAVEEKAAVYFT